MWPGDLELIYGALPKLSTSHGFPRNAKPFIAQERDKFQFQIQYNTVNFSSPQKSVNKSGVQQQIG